MKVILYTRDNCVFCDGAKKLLKLAEWPVEEIKVGVGITREALLTKLGKTDADKVTLPVVYINDKYIGGFEELKKFMLPSANKVT